MSTPVGDPTAQLLALEAIKQLKARYFRAIDTQDWESFGAVFTDDAVLDVPEADAVEHGRDRIVAAVSGALAGARTVHHGHMPEIELLAADRARGVWAMYDYVEWPPTDGGHRVGMHGYGHYRDDYRRVGGDWRIARTRLERLRIDPLDPGADPRRRRPRPPMDTG